MSFTAPVKSRVLRPQRTSSTLSGHHFMRTQRLDNYLRAYRKNSGLTQEEVAFLLGFDNANLVSRYEKRQRMPPVRTALAYEAIFGIPIAELFAGVRQGIVSDVEKAAFGTNESTVREGPERNRGAHDESAQA